MGRSSEEDELELEELEEELPLEELTASPSFCAAAKMVDYRAALFTAITGSALTGEATLLFATFLGPTVVYDYLSGCYVGFGLKFVLRFWFIWPFLSSIDVTQRRISWTDP